MTWVQRASREGIAVVVTALALACDGNGPTGATGSIQVTVNPPTLSVPQGGNGWEVDQRMAQVPSDTGGRLTASARCRRLSTDAERINGSRKDAPTINMMRSGLTDGAGPL